jgi:tRNA G18 (ribose-2'-O)-methylase SpoU
MVERLSSAETEVYVCEDETLAGITGFNFHRGCLALAVRPAPVPVDQLSGGRRVLALEGVNNPDNVGGLFRTAAAFGLDGVLLDPRAGDPLYRKAIRTSMGASLRVPYARADEWRETLEAFRGRGYRIVALTPHADAPPLESIAGDVRTADRVLMLVGAEGPGLQDTTLSGADLQARIPIDSTVDSLNVVVAAGIALYCCLGRVPRA